MRGGQTYYTILGASEGASLEQLRRAFKREVGIWHPNRNAQRHGQAQYRIVAVLEAWHVLSNADSRAAYDSFLTSGAAEDVWSNTKHASRALSAARSAGSGTEKEMLRLAEPQAITARRRVSATLVALGALGGGVLGFIYFGPVGAMLCVLAGIWLGGCLGFLVPFVLAAAIGAAIGYELGQTEAIAGAVLGFAIAVAFSAGWKGNR